MEDVIWVGLSLYVTHTSSALGRTRVALWRALAPGFHPGAIVFILMYLNFIMKIYILLKKSVPKALKLYMLIRKCIFSSSSCSRAVVGRMLTLHMGSLLQGGFLSFCETDRLPKALVE